MRRSLARLVALTACQARLLAAQEPGPTLSSAIKGRSVIEAAVSAMGGRQALRSIRSLEIEESIRRTAGRQGLRPSAPSITYGRRMVSFDVPGQRIAERRILDITGNQLWDVDRIILPNGGAFVYWPNMTFDSLPSSSLGRERAAFGRRHLLPLLLTLERRPDAARWLGESALGGQLHDAVGVTDVDGAQFTLLFDRQTHLPAAMEQLVVSSAVGDTVDVSYFSEYRKVGTLLLPHHRVERRAPDQEWDYRTLRLELNAPIADTVFALPARPALSRATSALTGMTALAPDVYLIPNTYESVFVAFDDYVLVLEGGGSTAETRNTLARIKEAAPGKPVRYVVATHFHDDHLAGLRTFIAEGATIVTTPDAREAIEALAHVHSVLSPDTLARAPREPVIEVVDRERVFRDARHEVRLYQVGPSPHVRQILIGYLPKERLLFEGDLLDIPFGEPVAGGDDTAAFAEKLEALGLGFDRIIPVHGNPAPAANLEKSLRRGAARAGCPTGATRTSPCLIDAPRH